jgi:hypothetical protein
MKRVMITTVTIAAFFLCAHRSASAMAEFCPASLQYERVGAESVRTVPGDIYGFELLALGPRTIASSTLAFDTSTGWFTVNVPRVTLLEKDRHVSGVWGTFTRRDYVSPVLYVRFPKAAVVSHAWVLAAATRSDSPVQCDPILQRTQLIGVDRGAQASAAPKSVGTLDPKDDEELSTPPQAASLIIAASPSKVLETGACDLPFTDAMVQRQALPQYPTIMRELGARETSSTIEVAIAADGTLRDAWVVGPSGYEAADDASLAAARYSTYEAARAYCRPVPSTYYFRVTFDPN